jgi:OOP family OmpA-OmpF porin
VIEDTLLFDSGSDHVTNIAKAQLDELALQMKQNLELRATVIGYSDSTGPEAANQRMSELRAEAVKAYLVTRHGIDPERITTEGRGEADPVGDNATAEGRAANRRVEIRLE